MPADFAALSPESPEAGELLSRPPSPFAAFVSAFRENRGATLGLFVLALIALAAIFAGWIAPHSPIEQFRDFVRAKPVWAGGSWAFPLGTDGDGRDMLSRLIYGARISLIIGVTVMAFAFVAGVALGLLAATAGSLADVVITRAMDVVLATPSLVLAVVVVAILGPNLANTIVAVAIVGLPRFVRVARATALGELSKDYVAAARVAGVRPLRLALSTVLPNCLAPLIVQAALGVSDAILEAAALGFLGLGAQPPTPEWGAMLADAREFIRSDPWIVALPGLAILVTVVAINLAGDGLRDALDPKMRRS